MFVLICFAVFLADSDLISNLSRVAGLWRPTPVFRATLPSAHRCTVAKVEPPVCVVASNCCFFVLCFFVLSLVPQTLVRSVDAFFGIIFVGLSCLEYYVASIALPSDCGIFSSLVCFRLGSHDLFSILVHTFEYQSFLCVAEESSSSNILSVSFADLTLGIKKNPWFIHLGQHPTC